MRLLDLFCGRWGWSKAFAARGWECIGVDLATPPEVPKGCEFWRDDILALCAEHIQAWKVDFICASPPCEQFSVHGMKHFHPNPPYPELGIRLFNHTRMLCESAGVPYVMENVRSAQRFVGDAVHHCGPFYLWGTGVPALIPRTAKKGFQTGGGIIQKLKKIDRQALTAYRRLNDGSWSASGSKKRKEWTAQMATIPPELANCVADYAENILEQQRHAGGNAVTNVYLDLLAQSLGVNIGDAASEVFDLKSAEIGCPIRMRSILDAQPSTPEPKGE